MPVCHGGIRSIPVHSAWQCVCRTPVGLARLGVGNDPWSLFRRWKMFEDQLGVRSTFFFVPKRDDPGMRAHPYRAVGYDIREIKDLMHDLKKEGWETGRPRYRQLDGCRTRKTGDCQALGPLMDSPVTGPTGSSLTRTVGRCWTKPGYSYDTTFGYNDDAGFRAGHCRCTGRGTCKTLLELPLHIQDLGLFGKFCWAPTDSGWVKTPCLHLDAAAAREYCARIFDFAKKYRRCGDVLWHYENLTPPRDWSGLYADLVKRAQADGAWVTTAGRWWSGFGQEERSG